MWHLSLAVQPLVEVSRWDRRTRRRLEAIRDKVMTRIGTQEAVIEEPFRMSVHWRKPLSLVEVNQLAPTMDVRLRRGRP